MLKSKKHYKEDIDLFFEDYMDYFHDGWDKQTVEDFICYELFANDDYEFEDIEDFCNMMNKAIECGVDNKLTAYYSKNLKPLHNVKEKLNFLSDNDITEFNLDEMIDIISKDIQTYGTFYRRFIDWREGFYEKEAWEYFNDGSNWY